MCGDTLTKIGDCSLALACTFDGVHPARHWLAVEVFELVQLAMEDGLDSAVQNMRELVEKIVFSERISSEDVRDWLTACREYNQNEDNKKTLELYQRCESIILNNPHSKDMGYGDGYCINGNMYLDTKKTLRHFMWYRDEPRYKTKDYSEFLALVQTASEHSDFAVTEQIARMLWFNELSVYAVVPDGGFILYVDGLPNLDYSRVGEGMPIKCLEYLLRNKLLEHRDEAIPCLRHDTYQVNKGGRCPLSTCPIWRR